MGKFYPLLIHQRLSLYDGFGHIEQPIVTTFCEIVMTNVDELWFLGGKGVGKRPFSRHGRSDKNCIFRWGKNGID
jgi:hypothetical protein